MAQIITVKNGTTNEIQYPRTVKSALLNDDGAPLNPLTQASVVNNLTTGGVANVLSAEQGKVLGASVSQLQSSISNINVSWNAITGKPTTFAPAAHGHDGFIARSGDGSAVYLNGVALDDVVITGLYRGTGCSNQPSLTAGWFYMTVISHGPTWAYQELVDLHNSNRKFIRHRYEGVWSAWTDPFGIVVNGKQAVVNAINGSLGYASGLTTSNTHDDYAWWIQNKVPPASQGSVYSSLYSKAVNFSGSKITFESTQLARYTNNGTQSYTFDSIGLYVFSDSNASSAIRTTVLSGAASIRKVDTSKDIIYVTSAPCSVNINVITALAQLFKL